MLQHDLIAALAMDFVGNDVQVEELDLLVSELVFLAQRRRLLAIDRRNLRFEANDQAGNSDDRILAHRHRIAPALQATGGGRHIIGILDAFAGRAACLGEADQEVGVPVTADLLLEHVLQKEVLSFLVFVGHTRVDAGEIVREWAHIMIVVLGPAREMVAAELAARPGDAEGRLVGALPLDGVFQCGA
jgi:hypothetical protein